MLALACLAAEGQGALVPCCHLLQRLIFVDGVAIDDDGHLAGCLSRSASTRRPSGATCARRRRGRGTNGCWKRPSARGAFGVPTFFLGDRMFWGNDRLVLLEAALAA